MGLWPASRRGWISWSAIAVALAAGVWAVVAWRRGQAPSVTTVEVTRGDYVDVVEIRGTVRPLKSILVLAPMQAGDLQILRIAPNGSSVKAGEVVVEFDAATVQRTIQELQSNLKQAQSERDQITAGTRITNGEDQSLLVKSKYDVERAKLDYGGDIMLAKGLISTVDAAKAKLAIDDAQKREHEAEVKADANKQANATKFAAQDGKIAKIQSDLDRAQRSLAALQVKAPADGVVHIMPNYRSSSGMNEPAEFRPGDSAWPGAEILELPNLASVHLEARLDESDRGHLRTGQRATIRVDAISDHEYQAEVADVSVLARVDFSSWPAVKNFDLRLDFHDADGRLRPGMSASARIAVGRLPNMLLVPADAVFVEDGRPVVYRLDGRQFAPVVVDVAKRSRDQLALSGGVKAGDRIALTRPAAANGGASR